MNVTTMALLTQRLGSAVTSLAVTIWSGFQHVVWRSIVPSSDIVVSTTKKLTHTMCIVRPQGDYDSSNVTLSVAVMYIA